jgi:hypothetical protein
MTLKDLQRIMDSHVGCGWTTLALMFLEERTRILLGALASL